MAKQSFKSAVDQYAELSLLVASLQSQLEALRPKVLARGDGLFAGKVHTITVDTSPRQSLDTAAVKGKLTPAAIAECSRVSQVTTIRIKN